jgi:hypothetical protein
VRRIGTDQRRTTFVPIRPIRVYPWFIPKETKEAQGRHRPAPALLASRLVGFT